MFRFAVGLALAFVLGVSSAGAAMNTGVGYKCTDDGKNTPSCTCTGVIDCTTMKTEGVCKTDTRTCTSTGCSCEWKMSVKGGSSSTFVVKPIKNLPNKSN